MLNVVLLFLNDIQPGMTVSVSDSDLRCCKSQYRFVSLCHRRIHRFDPKFFLIMVLGLQQHTCALW